MTNDEISTAVAEALGWKNISNSTNWITHPNGKNTFYHPMKKHWSDITGDFTEDWNTRPEILKALSGGEFVRIAEMIGKRGGYHSAITGAIIATLNLDQLTLCTLFLKVKGLWREEA